MPSPAHRPSHVIEATDDLQVDEETIYGIPCSMAWSFSDPAAHVAFTEVGDGVQVVSLNRGEKTSGSELLAWLRARFPGSEIVVTGASSGTEGFYDKMVARGLIDSWTRTTHRDYVGEAQTPTGGWLSPDGEWLGADRQPNPDALSDSGWRQVDPDGPDALVARGQRPLTQSQFRSLRDRAQESGCSLVYDASPEAGMVLVWSSASTSPKAAVESMITRGPARSVIEALLPIPRAYSGYMGGTTPAGSLIVEPSDHVIQSDHSEFGVRQNRFRWARGAPDTLFWTDQPDPEIRDQAAEAVQRKTGDRIMRHRFYPDSWHTWRDRVEDAANLERKIEQRRAVA